MIWCFLVSILTLGFRLGLSLTWPGLYPSRHFLAIPGLGLDNNGIHYSPTNAWLTYKMGSGFWKNFLLKNKMGFPVWKTFTLSVNTWNKGTVGHPKFSCVIHFFGDIALPWSAIILHDVLCLAHSRTSNSNVLTLGSNRKGSLLTRLPDAANTRWAVKRKPNKRLVWDR